MKKVFIIAVAIVVVLTLVLSFAVYKNVTEKSGIRVTTDINNYNSEKYPIPNYSFPLNLPTNAEVVSFSYFNYWHEAVDVYLELAFDTAE